MSHPDDTDNGLHLCIARYSNHGTKKPPMTSTEGIFGVLFMVYLVALLDSPLDSGTDVRVDIAINQPSVSRGDIVSNLPNTRGDIPIFAID